ncbi:MAG: tetratricopeptide repeat protein [Bacteroidales bacterium]
MKDLIDRYLEGEMTVREQTSFEELLRKNKELREEFLLRKDINKAIAEEDIMELRDNLDDIMNKKTVKRLPKLAFYSAVAAVITIFIVVGVKFILPTAENNGDYIFDVYYENYPSILNARSAGEVSQQELLTRQAFQYYDAQNYKKAINQFKELLSFDTTNHLAMFYIAIAYIELEKYSDAEYYLLQLINNPNQIFWEQSHWYLSLIYLKQNKYDDANKILSVIVKENLYNTSEANEIIEKIN